MTTILLDTPIDGSTHLQVANYQINVQRGMVRFRLYLGSVPDDTFVFRTMVPAKVMGEEGETLASDMTANGLGPGLVWLKANGYAGEDVIL